MLSGFQSNGYQRNGYQIAVVISSVAAPPAPNGNRSQDYQPTYHELERLRQQGEAYREEERKAALELKAAQYRIEQLEFKRLRDLANQQLQQELLDLLKVEQSLLLALAELQRKEFMRRLYEDDVLILLMSLPFNA